MVDDAFTEVLNSISNGDKPNFADIPVNEIVTEFVEGINHIFLNGVQQIILKLDILVKTEYLKEYVKKLKVQ